MDSFEFRTYVAPVQFNRPQYHPAGRRTREVRPLYQPLRRRFMKARIVLALVVLFIIAIPSFAGDERNGPVGRMTVSAAAIEWQSSGTFDRLVLVVAAPNGTSITREFQGNHATFRLGDLAPRVAAEGTYIYELRAIPKISDEVKQRLAAARARDDDDAAARIKAEAGIGEPVVQAGAFSVR